MSFKSKLFCLVKSGKILSLWLSVSEAPSTTIYLYDSGSWEATEALLHGGAMEGQLVVL